MMVIAPICKRTLLKEVGYYVLIPLVTSGPDDAYKSGSGNTKNIKNAYMTGYLTIYST